MYVIIVASDGTTTLAINNELSQGPKGDTGSQGPQGVQGLQGVQGIQGQEGEQGIQGLRGQKGDRGNTGIQGPIGPAGPQGIQGPIGPLGAAGPKGDTGTISEEEINEMVFNAIMAYLPITEVPEVVYPPIIELQGGVVAGSKIMLSTAGVYKNWFAQNSSKSYEIFFDTISRGVFNANTGYTIISDDIGKSVVVKEIATNPIGNSTPTNSNQVNLITKLELSEVFYQPYMNKDYIEKISFNLDFSLANLSNGAISDRYDYINYMYVGTTTPNGYVLGSIVPAATGRTFSLSGAGAAGLTVDTNTGVITLTDNTTWGTVETKSINLIVSDLGTFPFTVPVVSPSSGVGFIDGTNGNDANSGKQPHLPKLTYDRSALGFPTTYCWKRGSTITSPKVLLSSNTNLRCYGDPLQPQPIIIQDGTSIHTIGNADKPGQPGIPQSFSNVTITDLDVRCGAYAQRGIYCYNATNTHIKRCRISGNISHPNSHGIGFFISTNTSIRHCEIAKGVYGDGAYVVATHNHEVGFNLFNSPEGTAGDCYEATSESNINNRCSNLHIHDNIMLRDVNSSSSKGSMVIEETEGFLIENNYMEGGYFVNTNGGKIATLRNNYMFRATLANTITAVTGSGTNTPTSAHHHYDNICNKASRGFQISGYNSPTGGWKRGDLLFVHNHVLNCIDIVRAGEPWTGMITKNIFFNNTNNVNFNVVGNGVNLAVNTGAITSITYNDTTNLVTVVCNSNHYMQRLDKADISGITESGYNESAVYINYVNATTFSYTPTVAPTILTGTGTTKVWNQKFVYTTKVTTGNISQAGMGPVANTRPSIIGVANVGNNLTLTKPAIAGATAGTGEWRINGLVVATADNYTIVAGANLLLNTRFMPNNGSLNFAELSCVVPYTDNVTGNVTYFTALFANARPYNSIGA